MADTSSDPDAFITIRLPASLKDSITALAERRERTLAAEVRLAIKAHVETQVAA